MGPSQTLYHTIRRQRGLSGSRIRAVASRARGAIAGLIARYVFYISLGVKEQQVDNPAAADRVLDEIAAKCYLLAEYPHLGPARPDIRADLRYFPVGSYLILYREIEGGVEIVRVVPGVRNLPDLFDAY